MIFLFVAVVVLLFGFVLLFGAPYLPTKRKQINVALDLLNLKPGDTFYELGCGDGRVLRAAAQRGLIVVGYELNPILVAISYLVTWKYRKNVHIVFGSFWSADLSEADGVFVFLLDKFMPRLDKKLTGSSLKLTSFAFKIPGRKITKSASGVYLYTYK